MVEMATFYFLIEQVVAETQDKHSNFMFVVPLPKDSKTKKDKKGLISSMLDDESYQRIIKGDFSNF